LQECSDSRLNRFAPDKSVEALLSLGLVASRGTFPHALDLVSNKALFVVRQGCFGDFTRASAVRPVRRTNGGKAREATATLSAIEITTSLRNASVSDIVLVGEALHFGPNQVLGIKCACFSV
jgi:hypothetical protein